MTDALRCTEAVLEAIRAHGQSTYPHECCGALFGSSDGRVVTRTLALPNTTEEGPRRRFLVRPADYRKAEADADAQGQTLVGFYHSHPDHPARPSQHDLDHAWPSFQYIIVNVTEGRAGDLRSWQLVPDRSAFVEVPVTPLAQPPAAVEPDLAQRD